MMVDMNVIVYMVGPEMVFIVKLFVLLMAIALMIFVKRSNVNLVLSVTVIIVVITMRSVEFKGMQEPEKTKSIKSVGKSLTTDFHYIVPKNVIIENNRKNKPKNKIA